MGQTPGKQKQLPPEEIRRLQRMTSFREQEIQDWYKEFLHSVDPKQSDNCITRQAFASTYNTVFPGQCDDFAGHIFRTFDVNGDNKVDFQEFLIGLSRSGSDNMQKKLAWAFRLYDVHKTGYITLDNMTRIIRAVFKMIGPQVLRYNNVSITAESLAEELFRQMDTDGDHRLSWTEFRQGVSENPTVVKLLQLTPPEPGFDLAFEDGGDDKEDDDSQLVFYR